MEHVVAVRSRPIYPDSSVQTILFTTDLPFSSADDTVALLRASQSHLLPPPLRKQLSLEGLNIETKDGADRRNSLFYSKKNGIFRSIFGYMTQKCIVHSVWMRW